jgi:hypothetical protein
MTLEQRCRRLVKKWRACTFKRVWVPDDYADQLEECLQLEQLLPRRKAKKPREEIRYGGTPPALRRKAKKGKR